jgi:pyroglutamyl-peptidase
MVPPRLLICGFGAFPDAPQNPSAAAIEVLAREGWSPPGVETAYLEIPVGWTRSVETVLERMEEEAAFEGVLMVGVAVGTDAFRLETQGRNVAVVGRPDHDGAVWPGRLILIDGPPVLPATAPVDAMLAALGAAGLPARLSDDAGDYLCNFTLYRTLAQAAAPVVGFLHVPQAHEYDPKADFTLDDVERAVRACATALAQALRRPAALPRTA